MTVQSKNDLILDTWRACDSVFKYAQDARDAMWDVEEEPDDVESNLRLARVACDAALERVARLRASR